MFVVIMRERKTTRYFYLVAFNLQNILGHDAGGVNWCGGAGGWWAPAA